MLKTQFKNSLNYIITVIILVIIVLVLNTEFVKFYLKMFFGFDNVATYVAQLSGVDRVINNFTAIQESNNNSKTTYQPKIKRNVSESMKKMVASEQQWKCLICQKILDYTYEIDHVVPLFKGGTNEISNLQALCRSCHGKKTLTEKY